jgi:hypothetical protein
MPISSTTSAFGPGAPAASTPNVPGAPTYVSNNLYRITSANDVLVLTSDEGGPVNVDVPDAYYTPAGLATALAAAMNGSTDLTGSTITFAVAYSTSTLTFTLNATSSHTLAYTHTGSDAAVEFGFTASHSASQYLYSDNPVEGHDTIEFDLDGSSNSTEVTYCIYDNTRSAYIAADGTTSSTAVWQTLANWNGGGASGRVVTYGTTIYTAYTFKTAAKNPLGTTTAWSANSASMYANLMVDWGTVSDLREREIPTGNTKIKLSGVTVSGTNYDAYCAGGYGAVPVTFVLQNNHGTVSRVALSYSEDLENYTTATDFYIISSANDVLRLTSDQGGPVNVDIPDATYNSGTSLAGVVATALNGSTDLTGGVITFAVTYSTSTFKYTIDATTGHTILIDAWNSNGAYTYGFTSNTTAAQTLVSSESRGECPRTLTANSSGVEHSVYWDSYTDAGNSEKDSTIALRLTPYDVSPTGGDAGAVVTSNTFEIDNTPPQLTVTNSDGFSWDEDTTPAFTAVMTSPRGGTRLFYRIAIYDYASALVLSSDSSEETTGWEYQPTGSSYVSVPTSGVSGQYVDGTNKIRYTVQAGDALTQANAQPYKAYMTPGEPRDV